MDNIDILKRSDTTQNILNKLRRDIILFRFQNEQQIKEIELSERYECSRNSVRSALLVLEKEGLLVSHKNGTKTISCLTPQDVDNLYDLRRYIELTTIKQIFDNKTVDFSLIFETINCIRTSGNDVESELDFDMLFHTAVIRTGKNKALIQSWANIASVLREIFSLCMTGADQYMKWFSETFKERHIELMGTLMSNKEKSLELFASHIDEAHEASLKAISKLWSSSV